MVRKTYLLLQMVPNLMSSGLWGAAECSLCLDQFAGGSWIPGVQILLRWLLPLSESS